MDDDRVVLDIRVCLRWRHLSVAVAAVGMAAVAVSWAATLAHWVVPAVVCAVVAGLILIFGILEMASGGDRLWASPCLTGAMIIFANAAQAARWLPVALCALIELVVLGVFAAQFIGLRHRRSAAKLANTGTG